MPAPMRWLRQRLFAGRSRQVGAMALARVHDVIAAGARGVEDTLDRRDRRAGQRQVVAHLVHVAALAAEVGLHVDDEHDGVLRTQVAVVRPGIGIGFDEPRHWNVTGCASRTPRSHRAENGSIADLPMNSAQKAGMGFLGRTTTMSGLGGCATKLFRGRISLLSWIPGRPSVAASVATKPEPFQEPPRNHQDTKFLIFPKEYFA